jgi:hypothetical protein
MSDEQQLNSVNRFRKQPGPLVLEEYGNCEVPAGCGGVVLRWRNPRAVRPVLVYLYTPVAATWFLDGETPQTGRVDLAPGPHLFALALPDVDLSAGFLLFAAVGAADQTGRSSPPPPEERPLQVLSGADGSWRFALEQPGDDWQAPGFDDRHWAALAAVPLPQLESKAYGYYRSRKCLELGAAPLGVPRPATDTGPAKGSIWIRKVFEVPAPEEGRGVTPT